jgi:co-chaperonin GroES (HSP10)
MIPLAKKKQILQNKILLVNSSIELTNGWIVILQNENDKEEVVVEKVVPKSSGFIVGIDETIDRELQKIKVGNEVVFDIEAVHRITIDGEPFIICQLAQLIKNKTTDIVYGTHILLNSEIPEPLEKDGIVLMDSKSQNKVVGTISMVGVGCKETYQKGERVVFDKYSAIKIIDQDEVSLLIDEHYIFLKLK